MRVYLAAAMAGILAFTPGFSSVSAMQAPASATVASPFTYADIADLATAAPIALHARIHRAVALKPAQAPGLAAGRTRFVSLLVQRMPSALVVLTVVMMLEFLEI